MRWICPDCVGKSQEFAVACSECINAIGDEHNGTASSHKVSTATVVVFGSGSTLYHELGSSKSRAVNQLTKFVQRLKRRVVFVPPSASVPTKDAFSYHRTDFGTQAVYWKSIDLMARHYTTFMDVFQMTHTCWMKNCTSGEVHSTRYVNRWKAQLLLNTLCSYDPSKRMPQDVSFTDTKASSGSQWTPQRSKSKNGAISRWKPPERNKAPIRPTKPTARFVPFPHREIGIGKDAICLWSSKDSLDRGDKAVTSLLGSDLSSPDQIQTKLLQDTICIPEAPTETAKLHLFSSAEARQCLANVTLLVSGDSYSRNMFIGLSEILLAEPSDLVIVNGTIRRILLTQYGEVSVYRHPLVGQLSVRKDKVGTKKPDKRLIRLILCTNIDSLLLVRPSPPFSFSADSGIKT